MKWFVPFNKLTPEQQKFVSLSTQENRVLFGGPGSGKTIILLYRAHYLCKVKKITMDRIRIFVYTNTMLSFIQSGLMTLGLDPSMASTFDSWCYRYYKAHIKKNTPQNKEHKGTDFKEIRKQVYEKICTLGWPAEFDALLVDEGQDLDEVSYRILLKLSAHITVACDFKQQIYEADESNEKLLSLLNAKNSYYILSRLMRCTHGVANIAEAFIENEKQKLEFHRQIEIIERQDQVPVLHICPDISTATEELKKQIRERVNNGDSVGIVFPTKRAMYGFVNRALRDGIEIETPRKSIINKEYNFSNQIPKAFTIFDIKGLTFDAVLISSLHHHYYANFGSERFMKMMFVAISRAVHWVYLSAIKDVRMKQDVFMDLEARKFLHKITVPPIQMDIFDLIEDRENAESSAEYVYEHEDDDDDILDLL